MQGCGHAVTYATSAQSEMCSSCFYDMQHLALVALLETPVGYTCSSIPPSGLSRWMIITLQFTAVCTTASYTLCQAGCNAQAALDHSLSATNSAEEEL